MVQKYITMFLTWYLESTPTMTGPDFGRSRRDRASLLTFQLHKGNKNDASEKNITCNLCSKPSLMVNWKPKIKANFAINVDIYVLFPECFHLFLTTNGRGFI